MYKKFKITFLFLTLFLIILLSLKIDIVNAATPTCGTANNAYFSTAPSTGLCGVGDPVPIYPTCTNTYSMASGTLTISANNLVYCISGTASGANNIVVNSGITTTIYFNGATTINMAAQSKPAITIGSSANVTIFVASGITATLYGGAAANGLVGGSDNGSDTAPVAGGYAAINVPSGATLKVFGSGTLYAKGGNAGTGGAGGLGGASCEGSGGSGGGGGGAGIGGNGGTSGAGNGHVATTYTVFSGSAGAASGTIYIYNNNVTAIGGNGGNAGAGGSGAYNDGSGGGGGYPGAGIGGGGAGGGGAAWRSQGGGGYSGGGAGGGGGGVASGAAGTNGSAGGSALYQPGGATLLGGGGYLSDYGYGYGGSGNGGAGGANGILYRFSTFAGSVTNGKAANGSTVINTRSQSTQGYGGGYGYTEGAQGTVNLSYPGTVAFGSAPWSWYCISGANVSAQCNAYLLVNGACGTTNNSCTAGTLSDTTDTTTAYLWSCVGTGGTTASCSIAKAYGTPSPTDIPNIYEVTSYDVYAYGVGNATAVKFPTWTALNGQDDIVWYNGTNLGNGTWKATIDFATNHNNEMNRYDVHVYGYDTVGAVYLGTASFIRNSTSTVGTCGTNVGTYASTVSAFSGTNCTSGTASPTSPTFPVAGATTIWNCDGVGTAKSCSELKERGDNTSGVKQIDPDGIGGNGAINVYCDMTTDGGGWTLVASQFESDPVTNWNEGIQTNYNPAITNTLGFALSNLQIPAHSQVAIGKIESGTLSILDYFDYEYSTDNIPVTALYGIKTGSNYQAHRNSATYYSSHDPEQASNTNALWNNTLTFDKTGGVNFSWTFAPNQTTVNSRGFSYNGASLSSSAEAYSWVVLVRTKKQALPTSCSELKARGDNTSGVKQIDPDGTGAGAAINVYCDMTTNGGGWTMVAAQFESDPATNWNEGTQADYDPDLSTNKGFTLNTAQIPAHSQVAIGKMESGTLSIFDYFDYSYTTGNIPVTALYGIKTGSNYQAHRNSATFYGSHDPEQVSGTSAVWNNTLTFDKTGGINYSWAFAPNQTTVIARGFAYGGARKEESSEAYSWVVLVRTETNDVVARSCSELKARGINTSGVKQIDPDGIGGNAAINVYCDMTTNGGGWTMVAAQFESDPVTNWNEGTQADYDPDLSTSKGFALSSTQIPAHNQVAFGQGLTAGYDYAPLVYNTGNIPVTAVTSPSTSKTYQIHRNIENFYSSHNPEVGTVSTTATWVNTLTFDQTGGALMSWAFAPNHTTGAARGYAYNGTNLSGSADGFAWTVWVRNDAPKTAECSALRGLNGACPATTESATTPTPICVSGIASAVSGTGPWTWTCAGVNGGTTSSTCTVTKVVDGACGSSDGANLTSAPTTNLCTSGTASTVTTNSSTYTWTCAGANTGTTDSCTANIKVNGACGPAARTYNLSATAYDGVQCSSGTSDNTAFPAKGTSVTWNCVGANTGTSISCTAYHLSINPFWIEK
ncbi:MAG: fibrinogen-like YCDxxxxGGGW domain-containing protein [Candidatus Paceibacterota bacterium]